MWAWLHKGRGQSREGCPSGGGGHPSGGVARAGGGARRCQPVPAMRCSALQLLLAVAVAVAEPDSDSGVPAAAHFAVAAYNRASNDVRLWRALRVLRARRQAEAGYKYDLTMELVPTQCLKNDAGTRDVELSQCPLAPPSERP
ncbi:cystatin isoform X2 [Alligator mississippiensis]|uniref:cystatin isoform X2 n=1 Tax=Alligator mississippiensis TaxID=8496 RepID=UPI0009070C11|nr:cystatin isoform X2 [Alligator mississippiensis]